MEKRIERGSKGFGRIFADQGFKIHREEIHERKPKRIHHDACRRALQGHGPEESIQGREGTTERKKGEFASVLVPGEVFELGESDAEGTECISMYS